MQYLIEYLKKRRNWTSDFKSIYNVDQIAIFNESENSSIELEKRDYVIPSVYVQENISNVN